MKRVLAPAIAALLLWGCSKQEAKPVSNDVPPVKVEAPPDPNVSTVDRPERFTLATVTARAEVSQITVNGVVSADVSRTVPVNALLAGRVIDVRVRLGDDVKKDQLLLTMTSPDMAQAFSDYQKFQAAESLAKMQLDRAQTLYARGALAQKDLEVAQDAWNRAKIDSSASVEHIRIIGGDLAHPSPVIEIRAPAEGTIIEQNVTPAAGVKTPDNSPNLFTIADLSGIWILCDVYENDLASVHVGDRADIQLNAYPNRHFNGRITNISSMLDPNTRSAKVRIELPNESGVFRPNMFATAHILSQGTVTRSVAPSTAILRLRDKDWAFVKLTGNQFRRTEVQAGPVNPDGSQQIFSGLTPGGQVVTDALLFDREVENQK